MQTYLVHDNGSRPFQVNITGDMVSIYKRKHDDEKEGKYSCLVKTFTAQKVFVGKDLDGGFVGNTIVLQMTENRYIFIGESIFAFSTSDRYPITTYKSPVGNSDVPYPYACSQTYVYLMIENCAILLDEEYQEAVDFGDPYTNYYGHEAPANSEPLRNTEIFHARQFW